jgi:hypothetical protein
MSDRQRAAFFVCAAVDNNGSLLFRKIQAATLQEASVLFQQEFHVEPSQVSGPFYKKRVKKTKEPQGLQFSSHSKKALYNGWIVNAHLLTHPADQAFLVFIQRQDRQKMPSPKGIITVPITQLEFL